MSASGDKQLKVALVGAAATLWLVLSGVALFTFQTADQTLFDQRILSDSDDFSATAAQHYFARLAGQGDRPILFFPLDITCPCSSATLEHLRSIAPMINRAAVELVLMLPGDQASREASLITNLQRELAIPIRTVSAAESETLIPSSPAAVVLNGARELIYFGPWSSGGACVSGIGGFVESAIKAMNEPVVQPVFNRAASGCYCDWRSDNNQAA